MITLLSISIGVPDLEAEVAACLRMQSMQKALGEIVKKQSANAQRG